MLILVLAVVNIYEAVRCNNKPNPLEKILPSHVYVYIYVCEFYFIFVCLYYEIKSKTSCRFITVASTNVTYYIPIQSNGSVKIVKINAM